MHTKIPLRTRLSVGAISFLLCAFAMPFSAQAGFQWVPPDELSQALPQTPAQTLYANPPPALAPAPAPQVIEAPMPAPTASEFSAPMATLPPPATLGQVATEQEKAVRGFANNIPLSVAMRQVLPQEYGFSVAQDVSLGTLVSWKGGAPWRSVVKEMLLPAGLAIQEQGQMIHVVHATEAQIAAGGGHSLVPMKLTETSVSSKGSFETIDSGKPMSLVPPPSAKAAASSEPLPSRSLEDRAPRFLTPPSESIPAPSVGARAAGGAYATAGSFDSWTADKGEMLRRVLESWGRRANVEVSWQAEYDFPLQASVMLNGSFEDAVRGLLVGFENAKPQPVAQLHNNPSVGQAVLVVQVRGNHYNE